MKYGNNEKKDGFDPNNFRDHLNASLDQEDIKVSEDLIQRTLEAIIQQPSDQTEESMLDVNTPKKGFPWTRYVRGVAGVAAAALIVVVGYHGITNMGMKSEQFSSDKNNNKLEDYAASEVQPREASEDSGLASQALRAEDDKMEHEEGMDNKSLGSVSTLDADENGSVTEFPLKLSQFNRITLLREEDQEAIVISDQPAIMELNRILNLGVYDPEGQKTETETRGATYIIEIPSETEEDLEYHIEINTMLEIESHMKENRSFESYRIENYEELLRLMEGYYTTYNP